MATKFLKVEDIKRTTHLLDAENRVLGRLSTVAAGLLMGKGRLDFSRHVDGGDGVIVINAERVRVTGKKAEQKQYKRFSGYPGGLTYYSYAWMQERHPEEIIRHAVKGMLPKNILGSRMLRRLRVIKGNEYGKYAGEKPVPYKWED